MKSVVSVLCGTEIWDEGLSRRVARTIERCRNTTVCGLTQTEMLTERFVVFIDEVRSVKRKRLLRYI